MSHLRLINITRRFIHLFFLLGVHVNKIVLFVLLLMAKLSRSWHPCLLYLYMCSKTDRDVCQVWKWLGLRTRSKVNWVQNNKMIHKTLFSMTSAVYTVNSKIFARVLFSRNFAMRSFVKIKSSRNGETSLSFTDIGKACRSPEF